MNPLITANNVQFQNLEQDLICLKFDIKFRTLASNRDPISGIETDSEDTVYNLENNMVLKMITSKHICT